MDIDALERRHRLARKLKATVENQKLLLDVLSELQQHLWNQDELRDECTAMQRELSAETVKTVRQWMDLAGSEARRDARDQAAEQEKQPDDLPF